MAAAYLMVVLDATIMNVALPSIQASLKVSAENLAWIVNAYALAFGGLLLLGGRAGDLFGRRRVFRAGIAAFALASLLGGLAPNSGLLIAARVVQGIAAAVAAPTTLSLIAMTFAEGKERNRAMGLYAAMAGVGSTLGLLLGGLLTEYLDWRWVLLVNIPIATGVLLGTVVLGEGDRAKGKLDIPGATAGTAGLLALVYAITLGGESGWGDGLTLACFAAAAVQLAVFPVIQARSRYPLLPPRLLQDRNRVGAYATMFLIGVGMFAAFYFLTLYMQQVLGYSAVRTGLAYLPFSLGVSLMAGIGAKLAVKVPPRLLVAPGMAVAVAGMLWLSRLTPHSSYTTELMPAMFVAAVGLGITFVPLTLSVLRGVDETDSGSASALLNTTQQVGGAVGLATLATLSNAVANQRLPDADEVYFTGLRTRDFTLVERAVDAMTHGYAWGFIGSALVFAVGVLIGAVVIDAGKRNRTRGPRQVAPGTE
ncbi:MFS transporter [Streptomyces sp. 8N616]|uniref:MFS transporter n=1 Tax=Streptomyces sp. 8N616 TaxID=3457414 RepID=UPI003FD21595